MRGDAEIPGGIAVAAHVVAGIAILAFALWRIALRLNRGAPAAPANGPGPLRIVAAATHGSLYLLLLIVPLAGLAAWFGGLQPAGEAHEVLTTVLMLLVFLHIAGALYQQFVLRSDVVAGMVRVRRRNTPE